MFVKTGINGFKKMSTYSIVHYTRILVDKFKIYFLSIFKNKHLY